ncbi:hypothetical protein [Aureimonas sp. Leaf454]|uniref:hypothetical protein n=1 Tax=Aureimonas sp. Leaf454 TaxID=1736381 RepID=UPI000B1F0ABF|nr:hypothetical protein [Aureimonas sp. Leaf454]
MALARMTAEGRGLLSLIARSPLEDPDPNIIGSLASLELVERVEGRWQLTRSGKAYLKAHR